MRRHKHNLSNTHLLTGKMGVLYPVGVVEVLPGDTFRHSTSMLIRLSPMAAPVMHQIDVRIHHFYVPNRVLSTDAFDWEDFITGGPDNDDAQVLPKYTVDASNELAPHMNAPIGEGAYNVTAFPFQAYNLIWNEYYRDQDLQTERSLDDLTLAKICWAKDYYTAARPFEQKGPDVTLPLGAIGVDQWYDATSGESGPIRINQADFANSPGHLTGGSPPPGTSITAVELTGTSSAVDINELRRAFALQRYAEARALFGSRYTEYLRFLGVKASDGRLQRPEYLGGGKVRVSVSEVLQSAPEYNVDGSPVTHQYGVGDMYGHGVAAARSNAYTRFFEEHGYVISLMSVRPYAMYQNAVPRHWLYQTKEDYWQRELENIGQQAITNEEVFAGAQTDPGGVWGYNDRYSQYRYQPSYVSGEFRDLLNYWHMGRDFPSQPVLNASFVECVPTDRIFNVPSQDTLWCMAQNRIVARRLVKKTGIGRIL